MSGDYCPHCKRDGFYMATQEQLARQIGLLHLDWAKEIALREKRERERDEIGEMYNRMLAERNALKQQVDNLLERLANAK